MQNRIKMRHLEAVIALAEEMHYGRVAERVGLTQSGLSRCIQSAEREANASLFDRNRSGIELTDAGRSYVEHARISVAHGERAMRSANETRGGADSVLQVGKAPDVDPALVDILYSIRLPLFPTLDITVQSESSANLAHDLLRTDLDLALITDPTQNAKLTMTKLSETPLHVVLPREHVLSSKASLKLTDLRDERWILLATPRVALLTKANALKLAGERLVAKPLDEELLCLEEWLAARAEDTSRLVSEFVRAFVTRSETVLQPPQMSLPIGAGAPIRCSTS